MLGIGAPPQTPRGIRLQEAAKIPSVGIVGVIFPSSHRPRQSPADRFLRASPAVQAGRPAREESHESKVCAKPGLTSVTGLLLLEDGSMVDGRNRVGSTCAGSPGTVSSRADHSTKIHAARHLLADHVAVLPPSESWAEVPDLNPLWPIHGQARAQITGARKVAFRRTTWWAVRHPDVFSYARGPQCIDQPFKVAWSAIHQVRRLLEH